MNVWALCGMWRHEKLKHTQLLLSHIHTQPHQLFFARLQFPKQNSERRARARAEANLAWLWFLKHFQMNANEIVQLTAHKFKRSKLEVSSTGKVVVEGESLVKVEFADEIHIWTLKFIDRIHGICVSVGKDGRPTKAMESVENGGIAHLSSFRFLCLCVSIAIVLICLLSPVRR